MKKQNLPTIIMSSIVALITLTIIAAGGFSLFMNNNQSTLKDPNVIPDPMAAAPDHSTLTISEPMPYEDMSLTEPQIVVSDGMIIYRNGGSGSCPPVLDNAYYDEQSDQYFLAIKQYGNQTCTSDYSLIEQTIGHEDGMMIPEDAEVIVE